MYSDAIISILGLANEPVADTATEVDRIFLLITGISVAMLLGITLAMIYFCFRYSRTKNPNPSTNDGHPLLELIWTIIPTIIVMVMFYWGWEGFKMMRTVPEGAREVQVTAQKWSWFFEYEKEDGTIRPSSVLYVEIGKPVKVLITSIDVAHSFYIPAFRVKEDAIPGRNTYVYFTPQKLGTYNIFCAEYCGEKHSLMRADVVVQTAENFKKQMDKPIDAKLLGRIRYESSCKNCHTLDGSKGIGPTFLDLFGRQSLVKEDGEERTVEVDEAYVRESVMEPNKKIVMGYPEGVMTVPVLSEKDLDGIIEYLKTITKK